MLAEIVYEILKSNFSDLQAPESQKSINCMGNICSWLKLQSIT